MGDILGIKKIGIQIKKTFLNSGIDIFIFQKNSHQIMYSTLYYIKISIFLIFLNT